MADEPNKQDDEGAPEQPTPEERQPEAEEAQAKEGQPEAEGAEPPEADAGEDAEDGEPPEKPQAAAASEEKAAKGKSDLPPGAELDPIALEPDRPLSAEEKARAEAEAEEKARLEAEATAEVPEEQGAETARTPAQLAGDARYLATGKRKSSIARVTIMPGDGKFEINRRSLQEYFPRPLHQTTALQALSVSGYEGTVDVRVNVKGGGIGGQAGAVRHGIARALTEIDPELRKELKRRGFLTRDARVKERRKAGLKKARKRPQFSKR